MNSIVGYGMLLLLMLHEIRSQARRRAVLASVITEHYPAMWVQVSAYGLAGMVGAARINEGRHWTSDVLAGAALGTFVGKTLVRFNEHHRKVSVRPLFGQINGAEISVPW